MSEDSRGGRHDDGGPVSDGPRLVGKVSNEVRRLTVFDALVLAQRMALVQR